MMKVGGNAVWCITPENKNYGKYNNCSLANYKVLIEGLCYCFHAFLQLVSKSFISMQVHSPLLCF